MLKPFQQHSSCSSSCCLADMEDPSHPNGSQPPKLQHHRVRGGWRSMPFIMGNEFCERVASIALAANLMSYLTKQYHMSQVSAATVHNVVIGTSNLTPLLGAFLSDSYMSRFRTILYASFFNFMGSLLLTMSATIKVLRPLKHDASSRQLGFLYFAFFLTSLGTGGLRPCGYAFGADQFQQENPADRVQLSSFANWYFFAQFMASLIGATVIVYIQENAGWGWGFGVPTGAMLLAIFFFILGFKLYRHDSPRGNSFAPLVHVIKAAFHKRMDPLPSDSRELYEGETFVQEPKLQHTSQFKFLDHAAIKKEGDIDQYGNVICCKTRLCSVTQVEEVKTLLRLAPIWISSLLSATALSQHNTFIIPEANTTNRYIGKSLQMPAASLRVFAIITLILWIPLYDRVVVPRLRRLTGHRQGIRSLQRVGIGLFIFTLAMVVFGLVEAKRRHVARRNGFIDKPHIPIPFSVFWFVPQYCIYGLGEAFQSIGQLEFLHDQLPNNMRSMAVAIYWCSFGLGDYTGGTIVQIVHKMTNWLDNNINQGHLDYFYYLLAVLQCINLLYFLIIARWYTYKEFADAGKQTEDPEMQGVGDDTESFP